MLRALEEFVVEGPATLIPFHRALLASACFVDGGTCSSLVESEELARQVQELEEELSHWTTKVAPRSDGLPVATRERVVAVEIDGRRHDIRIHTTEPPWAELARRRQGRGTGLSGDATRLVTSPMQGVVLRVDVANGTNVVAGDLICVIEAMKMENEITAHRDGVVAGLDVAPGTQVVHGQLICMLEDG
jgi:acetyl-CoA/propionyl-CoA carboxylase biotin carboxyl carrier protein